ncbi:hypothetical protein EDC94DRAFT_649902 [Helicostylum pulchrum]|nr:hypothetical protein EDC94DRAFT_649902 [Helicostylum pulchrum]
METLFYLLINCPCNVQALDLYTTMLFLMIRSTIIRETKQNYPEMDKNKFKPGGTLSRQYLNEGPFRKKNLQAAHVGIEFAGETIFLVFFKVIKSYQNRSSSTMLIYSRYCIIAVRFIYFDFFFLSKKEKKGCL